MNSETIELSIVISSAIYVIVLFLIIARKAIGYHIINKIPTSESRQREIDLPEVKLKLTPEQRAKWISVKDRMPLPTNPVYDSSVTPPAKSPENFGWITIEEGCEKPEQLKDVPVKDKGVESAWLDGNNNWRSGSIGSVVRPIAWYKVPPYLGR